MHSLDININVLAKIYAGPLNIRTALATYPRSGNTWTRLMIEKTTGFLTSSEYCDTTLKATFKAECSERNNFLIKTHHPVGKLRNDLTSVKPKSNKVLEYDRAIVIVRNPFDAIYSYYSYIKTGRSHIKKVDIIEDSSTVNLSYLIDKYSVHYNYWMNSRIEKTVLKYEDLKRRPSLSLRHIVDFLLDVNRYKNSMFGSTSADQDNLDLVSDQRLECAIQDNVSAYSSNTSSEMIFYSMKYYSKKDVYLILEGTKQIICQMGYNYMFPGWLERKTWDYPTSNRSISIDETIIEMLSNFNCNSTATASNDSITNNIVDDS